MGSMLVQHPDVDKIAFTGSTEVGRILRRQTAGTGKKLAGVWGKSPFTLEDADLDSAIEGVVDAICSTRQSAGRACWCRKTSPSASSRSQWRMDRLRVGNPLDKGIDIGAIVDEAARNHRPG